MSEPVIHVRHGEKILLVEVECKVGADWLGWQALLRAAAERQAMLMSATLACDPNDEGKWLITGYLRP